MTVITLAIVTLTLDFNIIYASRIIKLLTKEINSWNCEFRYAIELHVNIDDDENIQNSKWRSILTAYHGIIDAYCICEKIIGVPFDLTNVILILCAMGTLKSLLLLTLISYESEFLYTSLKNAQAMCVSVSIQENWSECARVACRQLQRESKRARQAVSACGLFEVDASLPIRFLSVFATYTVVLLQFNFL
ncbi:uncharacterized protein [Battus philenor]|uniref:uncharacterized protein n=1 Tax=Battus philenor TaxID=42288 RepID=UPI0035CF36AC